VEEEVTETKPQQSGTGEEDLFRCPYYSTTVRIAMLRPVSDMFNLDADVKPYLSLKTHDIDVPDRDTEWEIFNTLREEIDGIRCNNLDSKLVLLLLGPKLWDQLFACMWAQKLFPSAGPSDGMLRVQGVKLARGHTIEDDAIIPVFEYDASIYLSHKMAEEDK
jgi:hypothetical protein